MITCPEVTLLITHYNRSESLARLLSAFDELKIAFGAIVISDDGSKQEHIDRINALSQTFPFELVRSEKNRGLGNNLNKGQRQVKTPLTLYIQEDFVPTAEFPGAFANALAIIDDDPALDLISFYAYKRYPYTRPYGKGYSERRFKLMPWYANHLKFYLYSDHPHLRRTSFPQKFGAYRENVNSDRTETEMGLSFIKNKGRSLVYDNHYALFLQENSASEPSTANFRSEWKQQDNFVVKTMRYTYLKWKLLVQTFRLLNYKEVPQKS